MIELALLRAVKYRSEYDKVKHYINTDAIDEQTRTIIKVINKYWESAAEGTQVVDMDTLRSMFFHAHKDMNQDSVSIYNQLFDRVCSDLSKHEQSLIINNLIERELAVTLANGIAKYDAGDEMHLIEWAHQTAESARNKMTLVTESAYGTVKSLIERVESSVSYGWTLNCLANSFKNMTGGRQTIIAGLTDVGKTSFALNIAVGTARQSKKPVIWLNNEGNRNDVLTRAYCIMFAQDEDVIIQWAHDGTLMAKLHEQFGREDPLRVYDIHSMDARQVEELLKKIHSTVGIAAVFFDMVDNIDFPWISKSAPRTDQILEKMYQWSRSLCVELDYPSYPMSQQSESKEYVQWPRTADLKDSKVGKQGASDNIIFITKPEDDREQGIRYLSAPKNKTAKKGSPRLRAQVNFHRDTGILYD